jgi:DNA replicative helicase MCM subunit Mcm2 (Cdc46/Mcm family)
LAKAKLRLQDQAEVCDVKFAKKLVQSMLVNQRRQGKLLREKTDARKVQMKGVNKSDVSSLSLPKQTKAFLEVISEEAEQRATKIFSVNELKEIGKAMRLNVGDFYAFLEKLNANGQFLKKNNNTFEILFE